MIYNHVSYLYFFLLQETAYLYVYDVVLYRSVFLLDAIVGIFGINNTLYTVVFV